MSTPPRSAGKLMKVECMDGAQTLADKLQSLAKEDVTEKRTLRSKIDEQSSLICILKQRADEMLLRCQALQKTNTELEDRVTDCQKELDRERKRAQTLEKRFMDLAANNQAIICFMEEYKDHNVQLKQENKQLLSENESLFSKKLHDKEMCFQKVSQDIKLLTEKYTNKEKEYLEKITGYEFKLQEQATQHEAKEASLLDQSQKAHQQLKDAAEKCNELKLKLKEAKEQHALKEKQMSASSTSLTREKDKLLSLSMERGKKIQEKQEEIQQLETKWKEQKRARVQEQDRFKLEAEAVNADVRVKALQSALDESTTKLEKLNKELDAFKEHSSNLLTQERELNKKLRLMIG
ncbi:coiled-coil domain-containing protein 89 [Brachyistius frenatus]|uniref:coiled-coil domain-containing protein 89 n=1 Tax=Brachyistius frenatus TaxID=100188 RepID=UPI0037E82EF5